MTTQIETKAEPPSPNKGSTSNYKKKISRMEMLLDISKQVAANDTLDEMLRTIVELITEKTIRNEAPSFSTIT